MIVLSQKYCEVSRYLVFTHSPSIIVFAYLLFCLSFSLIFISGVTSFEMPLFLRLILQLIHESAINKASQHVNRREREENINILT